MTREQAQELLANVNGKIEMKRLDAVNLLFKEIDELKIMEEDAQQYALKCRKELEALQQPKSCEGCKHYKFTYNSNDGAVRQLMTICSDCFRRLNRDNYEPKEQ